MSLQFRKLKVHEVKIPFRRPFHHAGALRDHAHSLILSLTTADDQVGWGEIVPRSYLTGESIESVWSDLAHRWWPRLQELSLDPQRWLIAQLQPLHAKADRENSLATYAGLDLAMHDAWSKASGQSLVDALNLSSSRGPLTCTLGLSRPIVMRGMALAYRSAGFRSYKLKIDGDVTARQIDSVRKVIGDESQLSLDANGSLSPRQVHPLAQQLKNVWAVEQPLAVNEDDHLLDESSRRPSFTADESICSLQDADRLGKRYQVWNLRLAKCGGFTGIYQLAQIAARRQIGVRLGVLVGETSLLSAASQIAAGLAPFEDIEFGFPALLLRQDPVSARLAPCYRGRPRRYQPNTGMGARVRPRILRRWTVRSQVFD